MRVESLPKARWCVLFLAAKKIKRQEFNARYIFYTKHYEIRPFFIVLKAYLGRYVNALFPGKVINLLISLTSIVQSYLNTQVV